MAHLRPYALFRKTKNRVINIGTALVLASSSLSGLLPLALSRTAHATAVTTYSSIPATYPGSFVSEGYEATQTSELGDYVQLSSGARKADSVTVSLTDWACQNDFTYDGTNWTPNRASTDACVTTPGSSFQHPVTLNIYNVDNSGGMPVVGSLIKSVTQTVNVPFRPSYDSAHCSSSDPAADAPFGGKWYDAVTGTCVHGKAFNVTFNLSSADLTLPSGVIVTVAYNTSHYGTSPLGQSGPYDSLNLSLTTAAPSVGTNVESDAVFVATNGSSLQRDTGWTGYTPVMQINTATLPSPTGLRFENPTIACGGYTNINFTTASWDAVPGAASYNYHVDGPNGLTYDTNLAATSNSGSFGSGVEGTYTFKVQAVDAGGAVSDWSAPCSITYDASAPTTPTQLTPGNNALNIGNDFYFTWTNSSDTGSPVTYEFIASQNPHTTAGVLDTGVWDNIQNGNTEQNNLTSPSIHSTGAGGGAWYWQVRALDTAGNKSGWSPVWKVTLDTLSIGAPTLTAPVNGAVVNGASVTNTWSVVPNATKYEYQSFNDAAGLHQRFDGDFTTTSKTATNVANNTVFYWRVRAIDQYGQAGPWSNGGNLWKVTVDNTAPVVAITAPSNHHVVRGTVTISGTVTDTNPDHYYLVVKDVHGNVVAGPGTVAAANIADYAWDTTGVSDGTYTIDLEARDAAGNKDTNSTRTIQVTVDNTAPSAPVATPAAGTYTTTQLVSLASSDLGSGVDHIYYTTDGSTPNDAGNGILYTGAFTVSSSETVKAVAYDNAGNSSTVMSAAYTITTPVTPAVQHFTAPALTTTSNPQNNDGAGSNGGQVLGDTTTPSNTGSTNPSGNNGKVKGDSTVKLQNASDTKNGKFLGLGWWWLGVVAALLAIATALAGRRKTNSN